ncbi:hypothetical protein KIN20_031135 [Parelaphostrongylus tenuis]|uniref:Secreted protein n=1 Tax=Parelaphostrongylus tenuis TaxID=148309 RepID=A0AAD5WGT5_PARTN|nr:hypothetical protein KIN20_031135 [Parelaphostrongylus tenuis]
MRIPCFLRLLRLAFIVPTEFSAIPCLPRVALQDFTYACKKYSPRGRRRLSGSRRRQSSSRRSRSRNPPVGNQEEKNSFAPQSSSWPQSGSPAADEANTSSSSSQRHGLILEAGTCQV